MFTVAIWPTCRTRPDRSTVAKPVFDARTAYSPAGSAGTRYRPTALVIPLRETPVSRFVTTSSAAAIDPPEASVMTPSRSPDVLDCALSAGTERSRDTTASERAIRKLRIPFREVKAKPKYYRAREQIQRRDLRLRSVAAQPASLALVQGDRCRLSSCRDRAAIPAGLHFRSIPPSSSALPSIDPMAKSAQRQSPDRFV